MEYALRKAETDAEPILENLVNQIPGIKFGQERQDFIRKILSEQPENIRKVLKDKLDNFLWLMIPKEASDIDIGGAGSKGKIWYRVYGDKNPELKLGAYSTDETDILVMNVLSNNDQEFLFKNRYVDFSYTISKNGNRTRFRATAYFELNHLALNMRLISNQIRPLSGLCLHPEVVKLLSLKYVKSGLVLITGITGSGKSCTLDTIIDANNRTSEGHIIIISNPIEYVHDSIKSIVRHREMGRDVLTFKEGTIQSLRQDPDIIVLGEVRDPDTIATVLEVADSGHKVFTTMHTSSTTESIDRILGETHPSEQTRIRERLADVLVCVISQKLVPSLDGKLILAKEVLVATAAVKTAIRNNNTDELYQMIYQSSNVGMVTMEQDLVSLYRTEKISYQEAHSNANNKKRLEDLCRYYKP